jgi:hypothetical protein
MSIKSATYKSGLLLCTKFRHDYAAVQNETLFAMERLFLRNIHISNFSYAEQS